MALHGFDVLWHFTVHAMIVAIACSVIAPNPTCFQSTPACMHTSTLMLERVSMGLCCAGLLAGIQAKAQRPEYARLLSDCQILYCDTRLQLVSGVTQDAILHMSSSALPVLARDGWAYLMQVGYAVEACKLSCSSNSMLCSDVTLTVCAYLGVPLSLLQSLQFASSEICIRHCCQPKLS